MSDKRGATPGAQWKPTQSHKEYAMNRNTNQSNQQPQRQPGDDAGKKIQDDGSFESQRRDREQAEQASRQPGQPGGQPGTAQDDQAMREAGKAGGQRSPGK
jgi:general stress protein YciG